MGLRRPKVPPSGAPYLYQGVRETHHGSWLAALLVGMYPWRRRSHARWWPYSRLRETCTLGLYRTSLISGIHAMVNWHLSVQGVRWPVSRDHIAGSSLWLIEVTCILENNRWPSAGLVWIAGSCHAVIIAELFGSRLTPTQCQKS